MVVMKKNLSNKDMKRIVHEITCKELKEECENVYPITYHEYFNELEDNVKLKISDMIIQNVEGYNQKGNIVIFLDKISKIKGTVTWKIFRLAENTYHEIRHTQQQKYTPYSYEGFLRDIDNFLSAIKKDIYYSNYNSFSYEIGANLYGVQQARKYIQKYFPEEYTEIIEKIKLKEEKYTYDYIMYDASFNINRFIIVLRNNINIVQEYSIKKISPILDIFLNDDLTFKSLKQIMTNDRYKEVDIRIVSAILSSQLFYGNIEIEELSAEELELLDNALKYTNKIYQNQSIKLEEALSKRIIDSRTYYYEQRNILKKLQPLAEKENLLRLQEQKTKKITR